MTGIADETDRCIFGAYPGPLRNVFGLWVEETDALYPEETNQIIMNENREVYTCVTVSDWKMQRHLELMEVISMQESHASQ